MIRWYNNLDKLTNDLINIPSNDKIVFESKNPDNDLNIYFELEKRNIDYIVIYELNNYEKEHLEVTLLPLHQRLDNFIRLSNRIGKERLLWKFHIKNINDIKLISDRISGISQVLSKYVDYLILFFDSNIENKLEILKDIYNKNFIIRDNKPVLIGIEDSNKRFFDKKFLKKYGFVSLFNIIEKKFSLR